MASAARSAELNVAVATLRGGAQAALARLEEVDMAIAERAALEENAWGEMRDGISRAEEVCQSLELAIGEISIRICQLLGPLDDQVS